MREMAWRLTSQDDWSPADNPYAIAVSEAQWWQRAVRLAVLRVQGEDDNRIAWSSPSARWLRILKDSQSGRREAAQMMGVQVIAPGWGRRGGAMGVWGWYSKCHHSLA
jgi:hypothetical protein